MNLYKALRCLVPEEIKALLEKIDTLERYDSSSYPIEHLRRNGKFTWLERKLLSNAVARVQRRRTLSDAMHIVIYGDVEKDPEEAYLSDKLLNNLGPIGASSIGTIRGAGTFTAAHQNYVRQAAKEIRKVAPYGHP
jgi:hypothetical protein